MNSSHHAPQNQIVRRAPLRGAIIGLALLAAAPASAETVEDEHAELTTRYAAELAKLCAWCDANDLADEAKTTRRWPLPHAPLTLVVPLVDEAVDEPQEADDAPAKAAEWRARFTELRQAQGEALFSLARRAAGEKQMTLAYRLAHETLREDPRHEDARKMLGYKLHEGHWLTSFEVQKTQSKQVWHPTFGWLQRTQVERYEAGERFYKGRWLKAEDEARLRADIDHGWVVDTEHYHIRTNHSLEEGVRLATRLERLHQLWRQLFVRFYLADEQIARLFKGGALPKGPAKRLQVTCFRNRDEYNRTLIVKQPKIAMTTGYYWPDLRMAYFFAGQDDSNLYHEATHQLFSEVRAMSPKTGLAANFWIVEGIACYMESLTVGNGQGDDSFCTLGGADAIRLQNARVRLLDHDFYVPLNELTRLGMDALQDDERIKQIYSQASGLTYFLIHVGDGRYRDALVAYLVAVYTARDTPGTLAELTGRSYSELDREYRAFVQGVKKTDGR
ncbi:MAG TPA: DUF1570 domain-containing protein [Pirellulales bacterium]|nr:DUF1570 domain-containing protein [Pirellulales bacterium]